MDKKKVIKGLEDISDYFYNLYRDVDDREEYAKHHDRMSIVDDAIVLLKEQEAVVRCKDCRDYLDIKCSCYELCKGENWYCADGVKKE